MRELGHYPPPPPAGDWRSSRALLAKLIASLVLYSLGYIMGSVSAPSHSPTKPQLLLHLSAQPHIKSTTTTATTTQLTAAPLTDDLLRFRSQCSPPVPHDKVLTTVLTNVYNGTSPYFEFPPPTTATHLLPPSRHPRGWGSTTPVFAALIATVRPTTIIELGTFLGASALHMAALTRDLNTTILCIDDFRGWPGFRHRFRRDVPPPRHGDALLLHQFMLAVAAAGESGRLLPLPFSTGSALQALCEWGVYGDLVEVDAGHDFTRLGLISTGPGPSFGPEVSSSAMITTPSPTTAESGGPLPCLLRSRASPSNPMVNTGSSPRSPTTTATKCFSIDFFFSYLRMHMLIVFIMGLYK